MRKGSVISVNDGNFYSASCSGSCRCNCDGNAVRGASKEKLTGWIETLTFHFHIKNVSPNSTVPILEKLWNFATTPNRSRVVPKSCSLTGWKRWNN